MIENGELAPRVAIGRPEFLDILREAMEMRAELDATSSRLSWALEHIAELEAQLDSLQSTVRAEKERIVAEAPVPGNARESRLPMPRASTRQNRPSTTRLSERDPEIARRWAAIRFA